MCLCICLCLCVCVRGRACPARVRFPFVHCLLLLRPWPFDPARGPAALSVYEVCNLNDEARAKEIVETNFAPVLDKAVEDGKLTSWGWNSHVLGGEYRVLQTMTAKDHATLLKARADILETIYGDGNNAAANEYSTICTSHSDYLWNVQHEKG